MIALLLAAAVAAPGADTAIGRWKTESKNAIVEIAACATSICGKLVTSDGIKADPDLRDTANKDPALRTRRLAGVQLLGGFVRDGGVWTGGTIYKADDGGTYKATVTPLDADHLRVKGCWYFVCKSQTWLRVR